MRRYVDIAPGAAVARQEADTARRRNAEAACALDFLVYGDDEEHGRHAERCVHGPGDACSREYDPLPYAEAEPDHKLYAGTGIGALYGLGMYSDSLLTLDDGESVELVSMRRSFAPQLAGWNLAPRTTR